MQDLTFNTWQNLASAVGLLVTDEQSVRVPGAALLVPARAGQCAS